MFPTIHNFAADDLTTQGYGALSDCISCEVTEELNGEFTLEMTYPLNGLHAEFLMTDNILIAKPSHNQSPQPFRINQVKQSFANNIKVYANHICYDMSGYIVRNSYSYNSLADTIDALNNYSLALDHYHQFYFDTDKTSNASFSQEGITTVRAWMGGKKGSVLDVYGGEWIYDGFNCFLASRRGQDTGYRISYGKNLAEYEKQKDLKEYSHVCAYWKKEEISVASDIYATGINCALRIGYVDATDDFEDQPSVADLNTIAQTYAQKASAGGSTITITPSQIGNNIIGLGDSVLICYETVLKTRVIKTVWDVIAGVYKSIQLGTKKTNITDTIKSLTTGPNGESSGVTPDDYIIEQGTTSNGAWHWEKWASGKAIAYTPKPFDMGEQATTSSYGNGYFIAKNGYTFPVGLFYAAPSLILNVHATTGLLTANAYNVTASGYDFYLGNMRNETVQNAKLNAYAMGRWKA